MASAVRSVLPDNSTLAGSVLRGGAWVVAGNIFTRISSVIRVVILGRLLSPSDFGIAALAAGVYIWLEQLGQTGLQTTLISRAGDIRPHLRTAWTINLMRSGAAMAVMLVTAHWVAEFLNTPELTNILRVTALGFAIKAFESPALVYVRRDLKFRDEVQLTAISTVAGLIVTVVVGIYLRNAWAVALGTLCTQAVQTALSYRIQPFRPQLEFDMRIARELFGFSRWIMWNNIAVFPLRYLTGIIVGKVLGTRALGFFQVASQLAYLPTSQIGFALSGLLLPAFAKLETKSGLRQSLVRVITVLTAVMIPGACFVSAFAELIIRITIGDKWVPAAPVAQLLVWAGIAASMSEIVSQILIRQGFPKYVLFVNASRAVILLGGFYPVLKIWGNCGMAGLLLFIAIGGLIAQLLMTHYQLHFRRRELLHSQRIAAAISAPVIIAYVGMMVLDLTYAVQAALAAITLASCGYVVFALRYSLANIIVPRSR